MIHLAAGDVAQLDALQRMIEACPDGIGKSGTPQLNAGEISATDGDRYMQQVGQVKDLIAAGDIFQANIARFWSVPYPSQSLGELYRRLREVNPAPFSCYLRIQDEAPDSEPVDGMHLLSASPERLFRISSDGIVDTRPIAGTRRRGEGDLDTALRDEMLLSDKERAEHIMLVDLERNDLGRVCIPGSVEVNETMAVEAYATVQHIVSNVRGRLRSGVGLVDVFRAMFPGGTITGCPKVRCMQIIHGLEGRARGPYTGGVGFSAWDGSADMNILIRTFWHHQGRLHWAAGAGIVADSDA
ncbi:MAG: anthranilate synthase component I family protein, partial [Mariprofundaceae bacterium]|nr:anthranilate synthase component I family protein [Mariprofundaceae bacterium]